MVWLVGRNTYYVCGTELLDRVSYRTTAVAL
jgi:hypothetical protein